MSANLAEDVQPIVNVRGVKGSTQASGIFPVAPPMGAVRQHGRGTILGPGGVAIQFVVLATISVALNTLVNAVVA